MARRETDPRRRRDTWWCDGVPPSPPGFYFFFFVVVTSGPGARVTDGGRVSSEQTLGGNVRVFFVPRPSTSDSQTTQSSLPSLFVLLWGRTGGSMTCSSRCGVRRSVMDWRACLRADRGDGVRRAVSKVQCVRRKRERERGSERGERGETETPTRASGVRLSALYFARAAAEREKTHLLTSSSSFRPPSVASHRSRLCSSRRRGIFVNVQRSLCRHPQFRFP